jgi:homoserine O-succinyltransferase/O-acetyltransferase
MAIVLPPGHPRAQLGVSEHDAAGRPRVRIGVINIMPRLEVYEAYLLEPLARLAALVEPVFVRLGSHGYQSSDHAHLGQFYRPFDTAIALAPLDGLIVTGAPVEELAFEEVHYFRELEQILGYARGHIASTLGLCWGGMVIGHLLGIGKRVFSRKLFGVFEDRVLVTGHDVLGAASFVCAHSRHSGVVEDDLERAVSAGLVRPLSRGEHTGLTVFETPDRRFLAHLGHPEYDGERLAQEFRRDRDLGRSDVASPVNLDVDSPATAWRGHQASLFAGFVARAAHGTGAPSTP